MKPSEKYDEFLRHSDYVPDQAQKHALLLLDQLQQKLLYQKEEISGRFLSWFKKGKKREEFIPGLYFWGGVGTGKTFIMDIFFEALPISQKKRYHFHHFMHMIHEDLRKTVKMENPVQLIARKFAEKTRVLCLDEFVVTDIGDAMLIARLLDALFSQGVVLVTTSNTPPEKLYREGLQRARFLPAIDLILKFCNVENLDGGTDYRSLALSQTSLYQYPHNDEALQNVMDFVKNHFVSVHQNGCIKINDREVPYEYCAESTIWFTFDQICQTSRSRFDYLEIACDYETIILTNIRVMNDQTNDVTRRFISLIDVMYDHRVKLICTAETTVLDLYQGTFLEFEFERTISRLLEMQSQSYVAKSHIA